MRKIAYVVIIICLLIKYIDSVEWFGSWAQSCSFEGKNFKSIEINGEECGRMCDINPQCTHYTWNSGTCGLKRGPIAKNDAIVGTGSCGLSNFDLKWKICGNESNEIIDSLSYVYSICNLSSVKWLDGNYSYACDFPESDSIQDLINTFSSECAVLCDLNLECTHYSWNDSNNGTCSLKKV